MTFGVVLFTLLAQGTTMQFLMRRLGLGVAPELELEYERRHGRLLAAQAALRRIEEMYTGNMFSLTIWQEIEPELQKQVARCARRANTHCSKNTRICKPKNAKTQFAKAYGRSARRLTTMLSSGMISEQVYEELIGEVDESIASSHRAAIETKTAAETAS